MARRSSARLRNRNSSTPKRVSLSHDGQAQTPRTAPVKLGALREEDEMMPGAFPRSVSPQPTRTPSAESRPTTKVSVNFNDATPNKTTPIKPTEEEMHPAQHQQSTVKPREEARWLGFSNMAPYTEPPKQASKIAVLQNTPTKASKTATTSDAPNYQFTFRREQSLELSPDAKRLMSEKRDEAAKIREQMTANGEGPKSVGEAIARKIATPKSKSGRYSEIHKEEFKKMDSIAGHASAFRAQVKVNTPSTAALPEKLATQRSTKSLKRSPSKAQLDEPDYPQLPTALPRSTSKPASVQPVSQLPRSASTKELSAHSTIEGGSPSKRIKHTAVEDVSIARPSSSGTQSAAPHTPQQSKALPSQASYPNLTNIASPTQASLARAASIKSINTSKIPAPMLARSPSKVALQPTKNDSPKASTPLLARSPSKAALFTDSKINAEKSTGTTSPLLLRSPSKAAMFKKVDDQIDAGEAKSRAAPLLSRTPLKMSVAKNTDSEAAGEKPTSSIPFLSRSPAKISMPKDEAVLPPGQTPGKPTSGLLGRFNLLRSSPMKSILRSPQRLYSDDPAKVAAGTHLATPPKNGPERSTSQRPLPAIPSPSPSPNKRVDFTSSTKARYECAQSEASTTPPSDPEPATEPEAETKPFPKPAFADYPALSSDDAAPSVTPQKRRQTAAPGDFTFRAGNHSIVFGQSPNAPASANSSKRASTIRHVSVEPRVAPSALPPAPPPGAASTAKRKFEFENEKAVDAAPVDALAPSNKKRKFNSESDLATDIEMQGMASDKENSVEDAGERPAKRAKPSAPEPSLSPIKTTTATRRPTLGVKPKKDGNGGDGGSKKPSTISRARLNALSMPRRRA